ncbi:MAG TPA: crosslink repair DNA glycosylase YcaQ family protein [Terriglobia bacterium]
MLRDTLSLDEARRIALAAQGFDRPRPRGPIRADRLRQVIRRLGLIQIDYVNVLVPAHYLVLFSRLGPYERSLLDDVVSGGREFTEQWAHEASILPVATWPLLRHRMESHRPRPWGFERFLKEHKDYVDAVLEAVRLQGPLAADDLESMELVPGIDRSQFGRIPGAWAGSVHRAVLEAHFGRGLLAAAHRRPNFARVYDLAERRIPPEHHGRRVKRQDAERELLRLAARAHGVGTAADLADYYRMPLRAARERLQELVSAGELNEVKVQGWREAAYLDLEARIPIRVEAEALLSPFDPVVWFRPRVARLFNFDYRIEIFIPKPKRRWGYYVLPFLLGDRLVARVDLKADRARRSLLVLTAYLEPAVKKASDLDLKSVTTALARELRTLAVWLGLDSVVADRGVPRPLAALLRTGPKLPKEQ